MRTRSARFAASGASTVRKVAAGSSTTLSGGAWACAPGGAPTRWNSESASGRSTIPSTRTCAGGSPARPIATVSPGWACRLAAVCWASSTPSPRPDERAQLPCERARIAGREPEHPPGPRRLPDPPAVADRPVVAAKPTGSARVTPGKWRVASSTRAGSLPGCASTCQSTATRAIARWVILASVAERKAPIDASSATATATPAAVATSRPGRRRTTPRSQLSAAMPAAPS